MKRSFTASSRASLLASAASLLGAIVLIPGSALAANECGNPATNGGAADTLTCPPGNYPTGIFYPTSNGDLTLNLQETAGGAVVAPTGGLEVHTAGADSLTIVRVGGGSGGDPSLTSTNIGLGVTTNGGALTIDLTDPDTGDAPMVINGVPFGLFASGGAGAVSVNLGNAVISAKDNTGVSVSGTGAVDLSGAATVTVTGTNTNVTGVAGGAFGAGQALTMNLTGPIKATSTTGAALGGYGQAQNAAASLTTANVTVAGSGAYAIGDEVQSGVAMTINNTGSISVTGANATFASGVYGASTIGSMNATSTITSNTVSVTNTGVANTTIGIYVDTFGASTVNSTSVTAKGDGLTDGIIVGSNNKVGASTITSGTVVVTGSDGGYGIGASTVGDSSVTSTSVTTSGGAIIGIGIGTLTGKATITSGSVSVAGAGVFGIGARTQSGDISITSGAVSATGANSLGIVTDGGGAVFIGTTGATTADAQGIQAKTTGAGILLAVAGNVTSVSSNAVEATIGSGAGDAAAGFGDGVTISAVNGSAVVATTPGTGTAGVVAGKNDKFLAADAGLSAVATNGDAVVSTGAGATITVADVDNDGATGVSATTQRAADAGGQSSARITLGATNTITVTPAASGTQRLTGVTASNTLAGGTGSASVIIGDGLALSVSGAGAVGVVATTKGTGAASVTTGTGAITVSGKNAGLSNVGIDAESAGGAVSVTSGANITASNTGGIGSVGILAKTVGTGTVTLNAKGSVTVADGVGVLASAQKGAATVTTSGPITSSDDGVQVATTDGAYAITVNGAITSGQNAIQAANNVGGTITIGSGALVRGLGTSNTTAVVSVASPGATTISNAGTIRSTGGAVSDLAVRATGGSVTLNNAGHIDGRLDFSGLSAGNAATVTNSSATSWHTSGTTTFSAGNDSLTNTASGLIATSGVTTLDFGADTGVAPRDVFNNAGKLVAGETAGASTLTVTGLETFNNSGAIVFGSANGGTSSDGETNDRVVMSATGGGTAFVGSGGSTLVMDVALGANTQTSCAAAVTADCLSLPGGAIAGSTKVRINTVGVGGFNQAGAVLVDAGSIATGSLVLDPTSANYGTRGGTPVIDTGLFVYHLIPLGTGQIALISGPDQEAYEFVEMSTAARDIWQNTTGTWFDRQADLRDSDLAAAHGGVWLKFTGDWSHHDASQTYNAQGLNVTYDTSFNQRTWSLIGGVDLVHQGDLVLGVDGGYVDSRMSFRTSATRVRFTGGVVGGYVSWVHGPAFLDGTINANLLSATDTIPTLAMSTSGDVRTLGAQVEGGWRMTFGANGFFEPVASFAYAKSYFDNLSLGGFGNAQIADGESARGSLGGRVGISQTTPNATVKLAFTGRLWDEFDGGAAATVNNPATPFVTSDGFHGTFGDVGAQAQVIGTGGHMSAFVNVGYKWKSGYHDTAATAGVRFQW